MKTLLTAKIFTLILAWLVAFFTPIQWYIAGIGFLVFADFVTGIMKAVKVKEKITSQRMYKTVPKYIGYALGIITAHIMTILFIPAQLEAVRVVGGLFAFMEIVSIDENFKALYGRTVFGKIIDFLNPKKEKK